MRGLRNAAQRSWYVQHSVCIREVAWNERSRTEETAGGKLAEIIVNMCIRCLVSTGNVHPCDINLHPHVIGTAQRPPSFGSARTVPCDANEDC